MHAYYRNMRIDYRYFEIVGAKKRYHKTKNGRYKYWELERCINDQNSPLDLGTKNNLRFLIGIRHEIEHQKTNSIDEYIGAKLQACALNYNRELVKSFGIMHSIKENLSLAIQFSPLTPEQESQLRDESKYDIPSNVKNFITLFESDLTDEELRSSSYSYKIVYIPISVNRANQADKAIEFISPDSERAKDVERVLIKSVEKAKYLPSDIVSMMNNEGYYGFSMHYHTKLWKSKDAKNAKFNYGVQVSKQWYWYESWVSEVREYCKNNKFWIECICSGTGTGMGKKI